MQRFVKRDAGCASRLVITLLARSEHRAQRLTELERELGRDLDVRESAHAVGAEERARPLDAVDQRHRDDRTRRDRLIGPQLDVRRHGRAAAERAAAPDDGALHDRHAILDDRAIGERAPGQRRILADVDVLPSDGSRAGARPAPTIDDAPIAVSSSTTAPPFDRHVRPMQTGPRTCGVGRDRARSRRPRRRAESRCPESPRAPRRAARRSSPACTAAGCRCRSSSRPSRDRRACAPSRSMKAKISLAKS